MKLSKRERLEVKLGHSTPEGEDVDYRLLVWWWLIGSLMGFSWVLGVTSGREQLEVKATPNLDRAGQ